MLAQAHLFTGAPAYTAEIFAELDSWLAQNPFQCGINWASALEVAFRALSWIWIWHYCSEAMPADLKQRFLTSLYQHGRHLAENLSVYFSPNTHLLGEGVALHALGVLFKEFPESADWTRRGSEVVEGQLSFQVKPDGSHFEQSTYYHVYAIDLFVFYYLLAGRPKHFEPVLTRMADYLDWLLGPSRRIAFFGDDDGGRLFHPFGCRDEFGRATLTTCGLLLNNPDWVGTAEDIAQQAAWWVGPNSLRSVKGEDARLRVPAVAAHSPTPVPSSCNRAISMSNSMPALSAGAALATAMPIVLAWSPGYAAKQSSSTRGHSPIWPIPRYVMPFAELRRTTPFASTGKIKRKPRARFAGTKSLKFG